MRRVVERYSREAAAAFAYVALLVITGVAAPGYFSTTNARDLLVNNAPVLIVAIGMTLVILVGEIDISVGSQFAIGSVLAGVLARAGVPVAALAVFLVLFGALFGALNGVLVARVRMPSIIVTLATFVAGRDALRWMTQGAWVQDLPANFQWFGMTQRGGEMLIVASAFALLVVFGWALYGLAAGRAIYAVGSNGEAARLNGIEPRGTVLAAFALAGSLTGLAALLNAVRFTAIPSNLGMGLELKVIAAVVVGGTAITGGRGTLAGTTIGVVLLGSIGTALTFAGINPFWEKAIQGGIILAAVASEVVLRRWERHVPSRTARAATAD